MKRALSKDDVLHIIDRITRRSEEVPLNINNCNQRDALNTVFSAYGDTWRAYRAVYELSYYDEFGKLPEDAIVIERVEEYPGGNIVIHRDPAEITN